jgi:hypothetical protein
MSAQGQTITSTTITAGIYDNADPVPWPGTDGDYLAVLVIGNSAEGEYSVYAGYTIITLTSRAASFAFSDLEEVDLSGGGEPDATITITNLPPTLNGKNYQAILYEPIGFDPNQFWEVSSPVASSSNAETINGTSVIASLYGYHGAPITPGGEYVAVFMFGTHYSIYEAGHGTSELFTSDAGGYTASPITLSGTSGSVNCNTLTPVPMPTNDLPAGNANAFNPAYFQITYNQNPGVNYATYASTSPGLNGTHYVLSGTTYTAARDKIRTTFGNGVYGGHQGHGLLHTTDLVYGKENNGDDFLVLEKVVYSDGKAEITLVDYRDGDVLNSWSWTRR